MMDIHKIMELLPHRYPMLLVDRVLELEPGVRISAIKNVTNSRCRASPLGFGCCGQRAKVISRRRNASSWVAGLARPAR